jgi:hypothetical protein
MIDDVPRGATLLAGEGYDAHALRVVVSVCGASDKIPPKSNRTLSA